MSYVIDQATAAIAERVQRLLAIETLPLIEPANSKVGADFAIPMFAHARELGKQPGELAAQVAAELHHPAVSRVEAIGGFVNLWLSDESLTRALRQVGDMGTSFGHHDVFVGQQVVVEHTDPNPFKEFHIGHTYVNTVGEAIARLYGAGGATVHQVLYYGDVGMHIARAIWGIQQLLRDDEKGWFDPEAAAAERTMADVLADKRVAFLGAAYVYGARAFEDDEAVQEEIKAINKHIYDHDDELIDELRDTGKVWSLDYFNDIFKRLHTSFEREYPESEVAEEGAQIVRDNIGRVFEESQGAVVYHGKTADLHTRVFINNRGLPTYEAKDIGLIYAKLRDYPAMNISHVITGGEQQAYYAVVMAAMRELDQSLAAKMRHTAHGLVKLRGGKKMSSRTGQVVRATDVFGQLREVIGQLYQTDQAEAIMLAALKYAYLRPRIGGDIIFDVNESVSMEGDSGPYVQYAYARGQSILAKLGEQQLINQAEFTNDERALAVKLLGYPLATKKAIQELAPHHICAYLYEVTQAFNRFYEHNRIVGDERQAIRGWLVHVYVQTLKNGLELLNIPAPSKL